jgi:hypothetical protein
MDVQLLCLLVEIVDSWATWGEDIVWLKANHVVQETAELVNFTLYLNVGARVLLKEGVVLVDLVFQLSQLNTEIFDCLLLAEDI